MTANRSQIVRAGWTGAARTRTRFACGGVHLISPTTHDTTPPPAPLPWLCRPHTATTRQRDTRAHTRFAGVPNEMGFLCMWCQLFLEAACTECVPCATWALRDILRTHKTAAPRQKDIFSHFLTLPSPLNGQPAPDAASLVGGWKGKGRGMIWISPVDRFRLAGLGWAGLNWTDRTSKDKSKKKAFNGKLPCYFARTHYTLTRRYPVFREISFQALLACNSLSRRRMVSSVGIE